MKSKNNHLKVLRILAIYVVILIPLLCFCIIATRNLVNRIQSNIEIEISSQMENVEMVLESTVIGYKEKTIKLLENREFMVPLSSQSSYEQWKNISYLKTIKLFDGNIDEIIIHYGEDVFYSSEGLVRPKVYFGDSLNCYPESIEKGLAAMADSEDSIQILNTNTGKAYIMYHYYFGNGLKQNGCSVEVIVSIDNIAKMLEASLKQKGVLLQISVKEENVYLCYEGESGCRQVPYDEFVVLQEKYKKVQYENKKKNSNMDFSLWYDDKIAMKDVQDIRKISYAILSIGLLLSVVLSVRISYIRFTQATNIIENIVHKGTRNSKIKYRNELGDIQSAIDKLYLEWYSTKTKVHDYRQMLIQHITLLIAHGFFERKNEVQTILKSCGVEVFEKRFFLLGIVIKTESQIDEFEKILQYDLHFTDRKKRCVFVFCSAMRSYSGEYTGEGEERVEIAEKLQRELKNIGVIVDKIAVSQVYEEFFMTQYAFKEVSEILPNVLKNKKDILLWEKWIQKIKQDSMDTEYNVFLTLANIIRKRDIQQAREILDVIKQEAEKEEAYSKRYYIRYMVVQSFRWSFNQEDNLGKGLKVAKKVNSLNLKNEDDFWDNMESLLQSCCNKQMEVDFEVIRKFVAENYMNYQLSLEMLAEKMGVSASKMSTMFRAQTGSGYMEYVTTLRMEKAKEMLQCSTLTVKEIFNKVGYIDEVSATKKFKELNGMTPTAYRKLKI